MKPTSAPLSLDEAAQREPTLSGLDRFARMLKGGSDLTLETHGSPNRPRYSAALMAAFALTAAMGMQAPDASAAQPQTPQVVAMQQDASDSAPVRSMGDPYPRMSRASMTSPTASRPQGPQYTTKDSTLSREAQKSLAGYGVTTQDSDVSPDMKIDGTAALTQRHETTLLGVPISTKMSCNVILVPMGSGGHLLPETFLPRPVRTGNAERDLALLAQNASDREMLDRFVFEHEDAHCDAISWSSNITDELKAGAPADQIEFNAAAHHLSSAMREITKISKSSFESTVLRQYSPKEFAKSLAGERYADSRALLHRAQDMLVQKGQSIEDFERVATVVLNFRKGEATQAGMFNVMNDHNTVTAIELAIRGVREAHAGGPAGMTELFGAASVPGASAEQMQDWKDRSSTLARTITQTSFEQDNQALLASFQAHLQNRQNAASAEQRANDRALEAQASGPPITQEVSRLLSKLRAPAEEDAARERMR